MTLTKCMCFSSQLYPIYSLCNVMAPTVIYKRKLIPHIYVINLRLNIRLNVCSRLINKMCIIAN